MHLRCSCPHKPVLSSPKLEEEKESKDILDVDNIQGDPVLGFNKNYDTRILLDITFDNDMQNPESVKKQQVLKAWLKNTLAKQITSTRAVREYRDFVFNKLVVDPKVFINASFGYNCIATLLSHTSHNFDLLQQTPLGLKSAFGLGAEMRAPIVGDNPTTWQFGNDGKGSDILLNFASDDPQSLQKTIDELLRDVTGNKDSPLVISWRTENYRGSRRDEKSAFLFGHEHYGFHDGLSQPVVEGKFKAKNNEIHPIERRFVLDDRKTTYAAPGFHLISSDHFVLPKKHPKSTSNRAITKDVFLCDNPPAYPDWCVNGSFAVYREMDQDVWAFWDTMLITAKQINKEEKLNLCEEDLKNLAGQIAARVVGRWWDGTPATFKTPLTNHYYPPAIGTKGVDVKNATENRFLKNGFNFDTSEKPWKLTGYKGEWELKGNAPDGNFTSDPAASMCPFASHIRKVNPRDQSTDRGIPAETNKHRIMRRGNNYGPRIEDVFAPVESNPPRRGLSLLMYMTSIEDQFEFLLSKWANNTLLPHPGGDDLVIGLRKAKQRYISINVDLPNGKTVPVNVLTSSYFTKTVGMSYFLLPPIDAVEKVLSTPWSSENIITDDGEVKEAALPVKKAAKDSDVPIFEPPGRQYDWKKDSHLSGLWDEKVEGLFTLCIWGITGESEDGSTVINEPPMGIAYRLPNYKELAKKYSDVSAITNLQFRTTKDLFRMSKLRNKPIVYLPISWTGFPKHLQHDQFQGASVYDWLNKYKMADAPSPFPLMNTEYSNWVTNKQYETGERVHQDEYCEWRVVRNNNGKLQSLTATCESPEYFDFLYTNDKDIVLQLYRKYVSCEVEMADLEITKDGKTVYNTYNKWNTSHGIMHLNQQNNSLLAEIYIAAEAATRWGNNGVALTNADDLVACAQYGNTTRASDPHIGASVNSLIRSNLIVSISNPVGLYFADLDTSSWMRPDKKPFTEEQLEQIVTYERGTRFDPDDPNAGPSMNLRVKVEIPSEWGYTLGDCFIGGSPIDFGGQIIESAFTVHLMGMAIDGSGFLSEDTDKAIVECKDSWDEHPELHPILQKPLWPPEDASE